jgi:two-component system sensor histidine kinase SenX3
MSPQRRDASNAALEQALSKALAETETAVGQRDQLLAVLDELRDGVLVVDAGGVEVFRNAAAERYREARYSDAIVAAALDVLVAQALGGERCERELQLFGPPRAVVHLSAVPMGTVERPLGVAAFVADVSEVHRIESVRRDFVANVSHELKTPIGALEVLAETLVAEDDPSITRPRCRSRSSSTTRSTNCARRRRRPGSTCSCIRE